MNSNNTNRNLPKPRATFQVALVKPTSNDEERQQIIARRRRVRLIGLAVLEALLQVGGRLYPVYISTSSL